MAVKQFDPFEYLRLQNIMNNAGGQPVDNQNDPFASSNMMPFNPTKFPSVSMAPDVAPKKADSPDNWNRTKALFDSWQPDTTSNDRLNNLLNNMPQKNTPGFGGKFAASLAAIGNVGPHFQHTGGGPDAADRVMYAPYIRDMAEFKQKEEPFRNAATLENQRNIQDRTLFSNMIAASTAQDKADQASKDQDEKNRIIEENNKMKNAVAQTRAAAYAAHNAGWQLKEDGNRWMALNPNTKQWEILGPSEGMSKEDTINLQNQGKVDAATASGNAAMNRQQAAGTGIIIVDNKAYRPDPANPGQYVPVTGLPTGTPNKIGTAPTTKPNALEANRARQAKLQDLYENDANVRDLIKKDQNGKYDLAPRPTLGSGKTLGYFGTGTTQSDIDKWDALKSELDPTYRAPGPTTNKKEDLGIFAPSPSHSTATPQSMTPAASHPPQNQEMDSAKSNNRRMEIQYMLENMDLDKNQRNSLQNELNSLPPLVSANATKGIGPTAVPSHAIPGQGLNIPNGSPADLQTKARDLLIQSGKPVTAANIDYVIQRGMVK